MPFFIVRRDITQMSVDAIVNAANNSLLGGGGVDGAIHKAAGPELARECVKLNGCETGYAKITKAYNLPCKYVIHTVGPVWEGGNCGEEVLLKSCYEKSFILAKENGVESIAFPLISSGIYEYPKDDAFRIATDTIKNFLAENDMDVYLVIFGGQSFNLSTQLGKIQEYITDNYIEPKLCAVCEYRIPHTSIDKKDSLHELCDVNHELMYDQLNNELNNLDESFSEMLFRLIDEKGITDVECYRKANIDRKVFSKIRTMRAYKPSKTTAIAFALALELPFDEAEELIEAAGYSLTHNNIFDIIVEYFITNKKYDVFEINEILFKFDQKLLGC